MPMQHFLSVCLSLDKKSDWTLILNSERIAPKVMKFGHSMDVGDRKDDLRGQDNKLKVKVTRSKTRISQVLEYIGFTPPRGEQLAPHPSCRCTGVGVHPHRVVHLGSLWVKAKASTVIVHAV